MVLISHRGNLNGKIPQNENHPDYIDEAIYAGYNVEIDIWMVDGVLLLGHDEPQYSITQQWLNDRHYSLWIHCKNIEALEWFNMLNSYHYFWHENDVMTLTSNGWMWVYPGKQPIKGSIAVMPEIYNDDISECMGVCSDYIEKYKK